MNHEPAVSRRYANWIEIGFTRDEFVIDFGQEFDGAAAQQHCGIVVTPRVAEAFLQALQRSLDAYRQGHPGESEP